MGKFALAPETDGVIYPAPVYRNLTEPTTRTVKGTCLRCNLPIFEDDVGEVYCEGCE